MENDLFESIGEPWDAAKFGLWDWRERFDRRIQDLRETVETDGTSSPEDRQQESIERFFDVISRAPEVFRAMIDQRMGSDLAALVATFHPEPVVHLGLDGRRLLLVEAVAHTRRNIDSELVEYLIGLAQGTSDEMVKRYSSLILGAYDQQRPSPIAEHYLRRAARLLLLGLDVECVVFCRAALESALKTRIDDDAMMKQGFKQKYNKKRGTYEEYALWQRIKAAVQLRRFDGEDEERAIRLKDDGNRAVHPKHAEEFVDAQKDITAIRSFTTLSILVRRLLPAFDS